MKKIRLKDMTLQGLESFFESIGEKKFRAKQVFEWLYKGVSNFSEMTNLPKALQEKLSEIADPVVLTVEQVQVSQRDKTRKYLFSLEDGNQIESVYMQYHYGSSVCISSQAGCRMNCAFCASAMGGLKRSLSPGEMLDQILQVRKDTGDSVNHVVVMGVGEPFDNYDNLITFLKILNDQHGMHLSLRNVTVSTCGIVPKIIDFAKDMPQVTLAISLHAPNNDIRNGLMPINRKYDMDELLMACRKYIEITNKRITFEYILLEGINDSEKHAKLLAEKLRGMLCHVNVIPFNPVKEKTYREPSRKNAESFKAVLESYHVETTVRRELGKDIEGACGQLRSAERQRSEA